MRASCARFRRQQSNSGPRCSSRTTCPKSSTRRILPDVLLLPAVLGAVVVDVLLLLDLGGHGVAAAPAGHQPGEGHVVVAGAGVGVPVHALLHPLPHIPGDEGGVLAVVDGPIPRSISSRRTRSFRLSPTPGQRSPAPPTTPTAPRTPCGTCCPGPRGCRPASTDGRSTSPGATIRPRRAGSGPALPRPLAVHRCPPHRAAQLPGPGGTRPRGDPAHVGRPGVAAPRRGAPDPQDHRGQAQGAVLRGQPGGRGCTYVDASPRG